MEATHAFLELRQPKDALECGGDAQRAADARGGRADDPAALAHDGGHVQVQQGPAQDRGGNFCAEILSTPGQADEQEPLVRLEGAGSRAERRGGFM